MTAPLPALYAARASLTSPLNFFKCAAISFAPPIIFCSASYGFVTPSSFAVDGINCITPIAPALETSFGLKFDSAFATALSKLSDTPYFFAAFLNILSYFVFFIASAVFVSDVLFVLDVLSSATSTYTYVSPVDAFLYKIFPAVESLSDDLFTVVSAFELSDLADSLAAFEADVFSAFFFWLLSTVLKLFMLVCFCIPSFFNSANGFIFNP